MELKQETINKRIAILAATDTKSTKYTDLNEIKNEILNKSPGKGTIDKLLKPYFRKLAYIQLEDCARNKSFWIEDKKEYGLIRINYLLEKGI